MEISSEFLYEPRFVEILGSQMHYVEKGEGDQVRLRKGPYEYQLVVRVAGDRRGSATEAAKLYEETEEGRRIRERLVEQHRLVARTFQTTKGRPTKKERRDLDRLKGRD